MLMPDPGLILGSTGQGITKIPCSKLNTAGNGEKKLDTEACPMIYTGYYGLFQGLYSRYYWTRNYENPML